MSEGEYEEDDEESGSGEGESGSESAASGSSEGGEEDESEEEEEEDEDEPILKYKRFAKDAVTSIIQSRVDVAVQIRAIAVHQKVSKKGAH